MKKILYFLIPLCLIALIYTGYTYFFSQEKISSGFAIKNIIKKKNVKKKAAEITPHLKKVLVDYEKSIKQLMRDANTPGAAIVIVKDSSIIYMKGFGVRAVGEKGEVDENTVFRIASVSKCFAAILTGILVEDSVFAWDDRIVKYLPNFSLKTPEHTANLTIRHVLSHTTGLPYHTYTNMVEEGKDIQTLLAKLNEVKLNGNVGEMYSYQNVAYSLIGEVIKSATGKTYEEQMMERVFKPLNMVHASISYDAIMRNNNIAKPHRMKRRNMWAQTNITNTYYNVAPAGGINASISDMGNWIIALLGNRNDIISDKTLDDIYTPQVKARSKNRNYGRMNRLNDSYYATGWRVLHFPDDTLVYHGGYVNGYRSEVAINRKEHIGICILANAPGDLADNGIPMFFSIYNKNAVKPKNNLPLLIK